ncbi:transposase [Streptosporangium saharense]|uniref:transposase n=1 Tax=Streptosporangium saharense TaxID=1706840 RepID=UPI00343844F1
MSGKSPYSDELRSRAVKMVAELRLSYPTEHAAIKDVAALFGIGSPGTLRNWIRQSRTGGDGPLPRVSDELGELRRENANLRHDNGILRAASALFAAELHARQSLQTWSVARRDVRFIIDQ